MDTQYMQMAREDGREDIALYLAYRRWINGNFTHGEPEWETHNRALIQMRVDMQFAYALTTDEFWVWIGDE